MSDIPQWLNSIITAIPAFCTGVATVLYAHWRYIRNRQFSSVKDKKRFETFKDIGKLVEDGNNLLKESMIKTLYESIGMFFPHRYNCYLLEYVNEIGLPYKHSDLNHFLKSARLMDINVALYQFELNEKKYFWRLVDLWTAFIAVTIALLPTSLIILHTAPFEKEGKDILSYIFSGLVGGAWTFLYIGFLKETQHCIGTKRFYKTFAPWLEKKQIETKRAATEFVELPVQEIISLNPEKKSIVNIQRLITRFKWKT